MIARAIVIAVVTAATTAAADPLDRFRGGAILQYDVTYVHREDRLRDTTAAPPPGADAGLALAGFRLRGFVSRGSAIGYLIGVDAHAGATVRAAFAYDVQLVLLGAGARLGRSGQIGLGTGVAFSGAVRTLDDAVGLPADAFLELPLGARLRLLARGRATWLGAADARHRGSPTLSFADELDASIALRLGHRYRDFNFPSGNGYFLGVAYREAEGARYLGATLGYSVDLGTPR